MKSGTSPEGLPPMGDVVKDSQAHVDSPFKRLCKGSNTPLSRDSYSKLRIGHPAIVAVALSFLFVDGTYSPYVYVPVAVLAFVSMVWVERAEAHEGPDTPEFMSPPTIEDIARELHHLQSYVTETSDEDSGEESESEASGPKSSVGEHAMIWREEKGKSVYVPKFFQPRSNNKTYRKDFTMAEVAKHNTLDDCWVVIESHVYDITKFVPNHPGGWLNLENMAGKDSTDAFANYHQASVYRTLLPAFYIGDVTDSLDDDAFTIEHRRIRQDLLRRGLFETNLYFYYIKVLWLAALLFSAVSLTLYGTTSVRRMSGAVVMAVFWHQLAFLGHDIGHNSISHTQGYDTFFGILFGNTLGGIGLGWWKHSHNVHHVVCNSVQHDPDIQHMPLFAIADDIFDARKLKDGGCFNEENNGFWSSFHRKFISPDMFSRFLVSNQHYLFYPIMAVARFNLYIQGWIFALTAKHHDAWFAKRYQALELVTLSAFLLWVGALVASLPLYEKAIWLLLSHGLAGFLHVQICISHFTMDVYHGHAYNDTSDEWFKMQCNTTMNVDCPRSLDFVHGGLQFQIEHHLFPRLPRHNLREARSLVKPFCEKWKVRYHEKSFIDSNIELVKSLKAVAFKCRKYGLDGVGGFKNTQIYEGLNAEG